MKSLGSSLRYPLSSDVICLTVEPLAKNRVFINILNLIKMTFILAMTANFFNQKPKTKN
jgi:hypothetical protein